MEKWPVLDQNHRLFYSLERCFFALRYHKTHSLGLDCPPKKGKMANFAAKPQTNPFGKFSIFPPFKLLVFRVLERRLFALESDKAHFPGLDCLKKTMEKWPILDQNHRLFELLVFIAQKGVFFFALGYHKKTFSWPKVPKQKRWKSGQFWTKTMD